MDQTQKAIRAEQITKDLEQAFRQRFANRSWDEAMGDSYMAGYLMLTIQQMMVTNNKLAKDMADLATTMQRVNAEQASNAEQARKEAA
jgi:hypothetical protein